MKRGINTFNRLAICRNLNQNVKQGIVLHQSSGSAALKYLSNEQFEQYNEEGYTIVKNVLSDDEVLDAKKALDELIQRSRGIKSSNNIFEISKEHTADKPKLNRVRFPSVHHPAFNRLLKNSKLLDCVEDLLGHSFRYMPQDKLNIKPAGYGAAIPWHQDWAYFPHTNDNVLTTSVLLHDATRENGCLQVIPGSHKGPTLSHHYNGRFVSVITDPSFKPNNVCYLEAPAGSVTIHNVRIVHGSAKNESQYPRSIVCFIYTAMDAWPLLGVAGSDFKNIGPVDFDKFNETLLRGEPTYQPRMEQIPVKLPTPLNDDTTVFDLKFDFAEPQP